METVVCDSRQLEMLRGIMQVQFQTVDLNLFLDTRPDCVAVLAAYQMYADQLACLIRDHETAFDPLLNFGLGMARNGWQWICDPLPWEVNWRRGV